MLPLDQASTFIEKAAYKVYGITQGLYRPLINGDVIAIVYNRRHPDGVKITKEMAKEAALMTWKELKV